MNDGERASVGNDERTEQRPVARKQWATEFLKRISYPEQGLPKYHQSWYRNRTIQREARKTVEGQVKWIREIDNKAMKTVRFNTILLGLILPAFSFAVKYDVVERINAFYTVNTGIGIGCLITSTALAGVTYTSSSLEAGVSAGDIRTADERDLTDRQVHDTLVNSYAGWIQSNKKTIFWNTVAVTLTILTMIYSLVFFSLGITSALLHGVPTTVEYIAYLGLFIVTVLSLII
ncbi:hypothetical protein [Haladaptatus sp. DYF46]|uniref:hypothetical protein n=1 Tax=Haladaptatus sp. DYF46 TaxID=2886041 RepID=UPI001E3B062F|nr:hypothetical protein [Haladaptatus sp. DYF46]